MRYEIEARKDYEDGGNIKMYIDADNKHQAKYIANEKLKNEYDIKYFTILKTIPVLEY